MTRGRHVAIRNTMIAWLARGSLTLLFWATAHAGATVAVPLASQGTIAFAQHREPLWLAAQLLPIVFAFLLLDHWPQRAPERRSALVSVGSELVLDRDAVCLRLCSSQSR